MKHSDEDLKGFLNEQFHLTCIGKSTTEFWTYRMFLEALQKWEEYRVNTLEGDNDPKAE